MTQPARNHGDGQPDRRRLDEALERILEHCCPVEVIAFGSAARGELQDSSDIDLLVVLADGAPTVEEAAALVLEQQPPSGEMPSTRGTGRAVGARMRSRVSGRCPYPR